MASNLDLAGKVARNVELDVIKLRHATVSTLEEAETLPEQVRIDIKYRSTYERRGQDSDSPSVVLRVDFKLAVQVADAEDMSDEGSGPDFMSLEAGYLLAYQINPAAEFDEECLKHFAEANGPYNAWPYWRELVQSVSGRLGLPGLTIPLYRPTKVELPSPSDPQLSADSHRVD